MPDYDSDREVLRLISAFKQIYSPGTRRAVVLLVEELAEKGNAVAKSSKKRN